MFSILHVDSDDDVRAQIDSNTRTGMYGVLLLGMEQVIIDSMSYGAGVQGCKDSFFR